MGLGLPFARMRGTMAHSARPKRTRLTWFGFGFGFGFGLGFGSRMGLRLGLGLEADEVVTLPALSRDL